MAPVIGKSGFPCFEGRILEAETHFKELEKLDIYELGTCLFKTDPNTTVIQKFARQWLYVLCRLAARCVPLPKPKLPSVGRIRFCPFAPGPGKLLGRDGNVLKQVFFPIKERPAASSLTDEDYRLFMVLDCRSGCTTDLFCIKDGTKTCDRKCDNVHENPFLATTIAILHTEYIALPTEDAQIDIQDSFKDCKNYLAWYLHAVFPNASQGLIANLKEICGERLPLNGDDMNIPAPPALCYNINPLLFTAMPHKS